MADALTFDDLVPAQPAAAAPAAAPGQPLTLAEQAYKDKNPGITDDQARYAVANQGFRDAAAGEGKDPTNPAYDRPGKTGDDTLYRVTPEGKLAVPLATFDDLVPKKVSPLADAGESLLSGAADSVTNLGDQFLRSTNPVMGAYETARRIVPAVNAAIEHATGVKQDGELPEVGFNAMERPNLHVPQTTAGRYARTVGEFSPAVVGGEGALLPRAANALVPAIASEFAGETAHDMGASPRVEQGVRLAGALAGAGGASMRFNPTAVAERSGATLDQLTAAKDAAYKAVDEAGIRIKPEAFDDLTRRMATTMDEAGAHAGLHPKAFTMLARIGASSREAGGASPTLSELDQLRQQIGRDVAGSNDAGERKMGAIMKQEIDDFLNRATADDVTGGSDPSHAVSLLTNARDLNTRVMKLRSLDNLDEAATDRAAATGTGTNGQNASRQNMIRFQKQAGNLSPDEQAAVQRAIRGTPGQNALRYFGALSPERGPLGFWTNLGAGAATGGHSLPLSVAALAARRASGAMQDANVQSVRDLISAGGSRGDAASGGNALAPPSLVDWSNSLGDEVAMPLVLSGPASRTRQPRR